MLKPVLKTGTIPKDGTSVLVQDTTGAYDATLNPGGYGAPNMPSPPSRVGFRVRYWPDEAAYANFTTTSAPIITALLGTGYPLTLESLGLAKGAYRSGVHHLYYYPFETSTTVVTLTQNSKQLLVTAGAAPTTWSESIKAVVAIKGGVISRVLMIDRSQPLLATSFYVDEAWGGSTLTGVTLMIATEAELKVLFVQLAEKCIADRIGDISSHKHCDRKEIDKLTDLTLWKFSAEVKYQCKDYTGAHNLIVAAEKECLTCLPHKTC